MYHYVGIAINTAIWLRSAMVHVEMSPKRDIIVRRGIRVLK